MCVFYKKCMSERRKNHEAVKISIQRFFGSLITNPLSDFDDSFSKWRSNMTIYDFECFLLVFYKNWYTGIFQNADYESTIRFRRFFFMANPIWRFWVFFIGFLWKYTGIFQNANYEYKNWFAVLTVIKKVNCGKKNCKIQKYKKKENGDNDRHVHVRVSEVN